MARVKLVNSVELAREKLDCGEVIILRKVNLKTRLPRFETLIKHTSTSSYHVDSVLYNENGVDEIEARKKFKEFVAFRKRMEEARNERFALRQNKTGVK